MYHLVLTLGHGSSAILITEGNILIGYENERITGIKSDSQYPQHAIKEISKFYDLDKVEYVYISHWATFGDVSDMSHKHWRSDLLFESCPNIIAVISDIDHHDCHVEALRVFAGRIFNWEIVADGFGNYNETVSIYKKGELVHRVFGFEKSIGLLYQYTTAFLGLKMNQDEFKLLGYESEIKNVANDALIYKIQKAAKKYARTYAKAILNPSITPKYDLVAGLEALPNIRLKVRNHNNYLLRSVLGYLEGDITDFEKKVIISFFVQTVTENILLHIIRYYNMGEVGLSGGIFMNVKLNNVIAKEVKKICVYPLCGDQGAGLGAYQSVRQDLVWPDHLFWGKRDFNVSNIPEAKNLFTFNDKKKALAFLLSCLQGDGIVNFVSGSMEFGARALGHTTTFALPTRENVEYINTLNDRSTIMPMAGMVHPRMLQLYFDAEKVYKSLEYMIITLDAKIELDKFPGCHHKHPLDGTWTNRMQVINTKSDLEPLLHNFGVLINTSFNFHGVPIVHSLDQILDSHYNQLARDVDNRVITIIVI